MKKTTKKISSRTKLGITKLQALKQMKKLYFEFERAIGKIMHENDLYYVNNRDIERRVSRKIRSIKDMAYVLSSGGTIRHSFIMCDLKTRSETEELDKLK